MADIFGIFEKKLLFGVHSQCYVVYKLADSGFFLDFWYQGGVKSTVFGIFEGLRFKIQKARTKIEVLNLKTSNTLETVDFTPP